MFCGNTSVQVLCEYCTGIVAGASCVHRYFLTELPYVFIVSRTTLYLWGIMLKWCLPYVFFVNRTTLCLWDIMWKWCLPYVFFVNRTIMFTGFTQKNSSTYLFLILDRLNWISILIILFCSISHQTEYR